MVNCDRESGAALVLVLFAVTLVVTSVLLTAALLDGRQLAARYEYRSVVLTSLSDAAIAETLARLSADAAFDGIPERRFGQGSVSSTVSVTAGGTRLVIAVGSYDGWRSVVTAEVVPEVLPRLLWFTRHQAAR